MPDQFDVAFAKKLGANICLSGGAAGADVTWGENANKAGHSVIHWSFNGHKPSAKENIYRLTDKELSEADDHLKQANQFLKRRLPFGKPWIMNLLRRNWYQVKYANSLYAVGSVSNKAVIYEPDQYGVFYPNQFDKNNSSSKDDYLDRMGINGGTGWACQLYFNTWLEECKTFKGNQCSGDPLTWFPPFKMYFYDQIEQKLLQWNAPGRYWVWIRHVIDKPDGVYAAIGTRDLNNAGKQFIENLYNN